MVRAAEALDPSRYGVELVERRARACVWGLGHIGAETLRRLARAGVPVTGFDLDKARVEAVAAESGSLDADLTVTAHRARATAPDVLVHFVAVPTEREGEPFNVHVRGVIAAVARSVAGRRGPAPLVIVESTLTPGTTAGMLVPACEALGVAVDEVLLLALAPRRDWLVAPELTERVDRVFGGAGPRSAAAARSVLSLLHDRLHEASSHEVTELVKCAENASRHLQIMLANQLTLAYPDVDVAEALALAGTKWNVEAVHPSFGTGGYCIPLSSKYLLLGAARPEELSLLADALETDARMRSIVAARVRGKRRVAILGLAYRPKIKVATLSPTLAIARQLRELGVPHTVHDPLYSPGEVAELCGQAPSEGFPESLREADAVLVATEHPAFRSDAVREALLAPRPEPLLVLDSPGLLADWRWPSTVDYFRVGAPNWLDGAGTEAHVGYR
ncbi:MAG: hypothetical protein E6G67_12350 [Actinobacteria bacterium]|nr:MAG: hypothetical protein E6G67_12350 [Actinomycetota bacterium]